VRSRGVLAYDTVWLSQLGCAMVRAAARGACRTRTALHMVRSVAQEICGGMFRDLSLYPYK